MSIVAIIPARGGSKRIPRKNIKRCSRPADAGLFDPRSTEQRPVRSDWSHRRRGNRGNGSASLALKRRLCARPSWSTIFHYGRRDSPSVLALQQQGEPADYACCIYATAPICSAAIFAARPAAIAVHPTRPMRFFRLPPSVSDPGAIRLNSGGKKLRHAPGIPAPADLKRRITTPPVLLGAGVCGSGDPVLHGFALRDFSARYLEKVQDIDTRRLASLCRIDVPGLVAVG